MRQDCRHHAGRERGQELERCDLGLGPLDARFPAIGDPKLRQGLLEDHRDARPGNRDHRRRHSAAELYRLDGHEVRIESVLGQPSRSSLDVELKCHDDVLYGRGRADLRIGRSVRTACLTTVRLAD
jgi:hypothetical protein